MMDNFGKEKYYRHGPGWPDDIELELDLPLPPYRLTYQPPATPRAPRMEAFIGWCIAHQVTLALALWAVIATMTAVAMRWF